MVSSSLIESARVICIRTILHIILHYSNRSDADADIKQSANEKLLLTLNIVCLLPTLLDYTLT